MNNTSDLLFSVLLDNISLVLLVCWLVFVKELSNLRSLLSYNCVTLHGF